MINIAVCDDDVKFLKGSICQFLSSAAEKSGIKIKSVLFDNGLKLINEFENGNFYDIVILDIDMPRINGKEIAQRLRLIDPSFFLIFMTSYEREVYNTIQYKINAFIPKKNSINDIESELTRVFKEYSQCKPTYEVIDILKNGKVSNYKIHIDNIYAFYFVDKILYMKTYKDELILQEKVFGNILERFKNKHFFECYRNYMINIKRIQEISDFTVLLDNGEKYPISKRKRKPLLKEFSNFVMSEVDNRCRF